MFNEQLKKRNTYMLYILQTPENETPQRGADADADTDTAARQPLAAPPRRPQEQPHQHQHQQQLTLRQDMQQCGAAVLGYIVVQVNSITAHVNKLAVAPEARRMGLATHLLQAVLRLTVAERRIQCATLHVDASNTPALGLYGKAGFVKDGMIEDYYGHGRHAYKLIADLQESAAMQAFLGC